MRDSIDPAQGARRRGSRRAALRGPLFLLALLASAAIAAATTSAQEGTPCDPVAPDGAANACPKQPSPPAEEQPPPRQPPPPEDAPPEPQPPPKAPAPQAPAARAVCPDGTWAPCAEQSQQAEEPRESSQPRQRRDCRKRPGVRRPKYCPRLRRQRSGDKVRDKKSRRERRRAARRRAQQRAEQRRECERARSDQLMPMDAFRDCAQNRTAEGLLVAGRLPSRPLADPLPPGSRLDGAFARLLERVAGKRWPLVLAMLREQGKNGAAPAKAAELGKLAEQGGGAGADERVKALADYHRAVGLDGLSRGLHAVKSELVRRVLSSGKVKIYPGGKFDVSAGKIDVRVLVTMLYLGKRHGGLTVTSLMSGHGIFTKSGNVSLHSYGRAVDVAAVGGVPVLGNQQPGGPTEDALRSVMLLPPELQPTELISLFAMGGPSFAMADHADHIHIGF